MNKLITASVLLMALTISVKAEMISYDGDEQTLVVTNGTNTWRFDYDLADDPGNAGPYTNPLDNSSNDFFRADLIGVENDVTWGITMLNGSPYTYLFGDYYGSRLIVYTSAAPIQNWNENTQLSVSLNNGSSAGQVVYNGLTSGYTPPPTSVPEPSMIALFAVGAAVLGMGIRRKH